LFDYIYLCMAGYHEFKQTGPVYLCLARELIQSSVNDVLCMLTHALETIALKNIKLENIWTFTMILRGIVSQPVKGKQSTAC